MTWLVGLNTYGSHQSLRVRFVSEELLGALSKELQVGQKGFLLEPVFKFSEVNIFLEGLRLEQVVGELRPVSFLEIAEDQVDPLV